MRHAPQRHPGTNKTRGTLTRRHNNAKGQTVCRVDVPCGRHARRAPQRRQSYEGDDPASIRAGGPPVFPFSSIQIPLGHRVSLVRDQPNNNNSFAMSIKNTRVNTPIYSYLIEVSEIHTHTYSSTRNLVFILTHSSIYSLDTQYSLLIYQPWSQVYC